MIKLFNKNLVIAALAVLGGNVQEVGALTEQESTTLGALIAIFNSIPRQEIFDGVSREQLRCALQYAAERNCRIVYYQMLARLFMCLVLANVFVEFVAEAYVRARKINPKENTPGKKGFLGDWYRRCVGCGKDGMASRASLFKVPAKLILFVLAIRLFRPELDSDLSFFGRDAYMSILLRIMGIQRRAR